MTEESLLNDFERAWTDLRAVVARAKAQSVDSSELVAAVDRALAARTAARDALAAAAGGDYWIGDQVLFERESKVGVVAYEVDEVVETWPTRRATLGTEEIVALVERLLVEPG